MKKLKKGVKSGSAVLGVIAVLALTGCGRKESGSMQADLENLMTDAEKTFGETKKSEAADNYEGMEDSADGTDYGAEGDIAGWRGDIYKFELEGENESALNGKITSILLADGSFVYAATEDGSLFMLRPSIYFSKEDSEIKYNQITDESGISELVYADQHTAYGKNHFVYFDMTEGFEEVDDTYMLESLSDLPDIVYTYADMQKVDIADDENLILVTEDAALYVYEDTDHHVCAGYKDSYSKEYTMYSDIVFEGNTELSEVTVDKSIFRFLLTEDQKLLYIKKGNISSDFSDNVKGVSVSYVDLTDQIDAKVTDIYNLLNHNTECCYAVDEEQNIYYVSTVDLDEITAEKITQFELGTIVDIQGFAGMNDEMLIRTEDGAYYFYDGDSLYPTRRVDALDENYKDAVLLAEGDILALGNDGYLYVVEDKN